MSSLDEAGDNRVGVWAMSDVKAVAKGGTPTLSSIVLGSEPYAAPVHAEQQGSSSVLEPDDDRMQQTQYIDGGLWGELSTSVRFPGETRSVTGRPGSTRNRCSAKA